MVVTENSECGLNDISNQITKADLNEELQARPRITVESESVGMWLSNPHLKPAPEIDLSLRIVLGQTPVCHQSSSLLDMLFQFIICVEH